MAGKRKIDVKIPQSSKISINTKGGKIAAEIKWDGACRKKYSDKFGKVQEYIDGECINRMTKEELHPIRNGVLARSARLGTTIGSGEILQNTPYARRQYYEHKEKSYWFERMKNREKDSILRGAQKLMGARSK